MQRKEMLKQEVMDILENLNLDLWQSINIEDTLKRYPEVVNAELGGARLLSDACFHLFLMLVNRVKKECGSKKFLDKIEKTRDFITTLLKAGVTPSALGIEQFIAAMRGLAEVVVFPAATIQHSGWGLAKMTDLAPMMKSFEPLATELFKKGMIYTRPETFEYKPITSAAIEDQLGAFMGSIERRRLSLE